MTRFDDIQLLRVNYLRGPNIWTYRPVLEVWLDLGTLEDFPSNKIDGFTDRLTAQQEAKKALLAKFKPKPAAPDPEFDKLAEKRAAEKEEARRRLEAEKAEIRRQKAQKEAERLEAERLAQEAIDAEKRAARKERKQLTKEEQKAARDARYAARKARQR